MRFLFWCASELQQFRLAEFESLSSLLNVPLKWVFKSSEHPWVILDMANVQEAQKIISRSVSVKYCLHLWAEGNSLHEFHSNLKVFPFNEQAYSSSRVWACFPSSYQAKSQQYCGPNGPNASIFYGI